MTEKNNFSLIPINISKKYLFDNLQDETGVEEWIFQ